jgi:D-aminopeptidase
MEMIRATIARAIIPCVVMVALVCPARIEPAGHAGDGAARPRARDIGIEVGILSTGPLNAITDVPGIRVGHRTCIEGKDIRTGVTVIIPHGGNIFREKVPGAVFVGNGFGKAAGISQIRELGTIETPIALTSTLNVPEVSAALIEHALSREGNDEVMSVNPVVGETNDGFLNDIRSRPVTREDVFEALRNASTGHVVEGSVGAGTGTRCLGFKGGIGTSSRVVESSGDSFTVGVLVQTNFGGMLRINGAPVGREMKMDRGSVHRDAGSCIIVIATDAPLSAASLERVAKRALFAMARTGSFFSNGSGDYSIAFSTGLVGSERSGGRLRRLIKGNDLNPIFLAAQEATEEAIYNSMLRATTVCGRNGRCSEAIPIEEVVRICRHYKILDLSKRFQTGN